ncbi:HAD family hydrolase [Planktomarina temperata]|nr:HAD family hydrolase [Planktomarina temperata]
MDDYKMKYQSKILSIDVWDTLIRRKTHPDASKLKSAEHLFLFHKETLKKNFRSKWDILHQRQAIEKIFADQNMGYGEYNVNTVLAKLIRTVVALDCPNKINELTTLLTEIEFNHELQNTYPDPQIREFLLDFERERTVFLSDFYFNSDYIWKLIKKNGFDDLVQDGFSSCEINANKRSGSAFLYLLESYRLSPDDVIHIGDNYDSDILQARKLNIKAIHYLPQEQHSIRLQTEERFLSRPESIKAILSKNLENTTNSEKLTRSPAFNFGKQCSPLFIGFILFISEIIERNKLDRVYFFTREGEFFLEMWNLFISKVNSNTNQLIGVTGTLLEVSRLSTFCASLENVSLNEFMRLWNQYSTQSLSSFVKSLGFEKEDFIHFSLKYDIPIDEDVQYPWLDKRFHALFQDAEFVKALSDKSNNDRSLLDLYLTSKNWDKGFKKVAIVDIGWRGTIQDNIARIRPNSEITGVYFGLQKFLNEQPPNVKKHGFLADFNEDSTNTISLNNVSIFEMMCNSPNGSVMRYTCHDNKEIAAVRNVDIHENKTFFRFTDDFQAGVLDGILNCIDIIQQDVMTCEDFRAESEAIWSIIQTQSDDVLSIAFQSLTHNETFGVGQFVNVNKNLSWLTLLKSVFLLSERSRVNNFLATGKLTSLGFHARLKYRCGKFMQTVLRSVKRFKM